MKYIICFFTLILPVSALAKQINLSAEIAGRESFFVKITLKSIDSANIADAENSRYIIKLLYKADFNIHSLLELN